MMTTTVIAEYRITERDKTAAELGLEESENQHLSLCQ